MHVKMDVDGFPVPQMYVRYLGTKVCWTVGERFYIGDRDELSPEEEAVCDAGGGDLPLSLAIAAVAR